MVKKLMWALLNGADVPRIIIIIIIFNFFFFFVFEMLLLTGKKDYILVKS